MSENYPKLTEGAIDKIVGNERVERPVLQILTYKQMTATHNNQNSTKYRFVVNDGITTSANFLVITPEMIERIENGEFERFTIIALNEYQITTQAAIDKQVKIMIIQDMTALTPGSRVGKKLEKYPSNTGLLSNLNIKPESNANPGNRSGNLSNNRAVTSPVTSISRPINRSNVCPISAITPYFNAWLIRARVTSKANLRKWSNARGEGTVFSFDVCDESGEMRINAFTKECDKFFNMIEANKVYYISKGTVKTANKRFSNLSNDYEITLNQDSVIELCEDSSEAMHKIRYKFVAIKDLETKDVQSCVDVIGILKSVDDVISLNSRKTNKELKKRDFYLMDKSLFEVRITLWAEMAEEFDHPINSVLAIRNAMVGDFNGRTLSTVSNTTIQVDPDVPETNILKNWFANEGRNATINCLSKTGGDSPNSQKRYVCQLNQLVSNPEGRAYSNVRARVSATGRNPLYKACGQNGCLKKVREENGIYRCDKCQSDTASFQWRIILSIAVADCSGDVWLTLFQEQAEKILNTTAHELSILQETDPIEFQKVLSSAEFKQFNFRLGTRAETYMDETRVKSNAYSFTAINPVKEAKSLIKNIRSWTE